jgi:hypothetical protein
MNFWQISTGTLFLNELEDSAFLWSNYLTIKRLRL